MIGPNHIGQLLLEKPEQDEKSRPAKKTLFWILRVMGRTKWTVILMVLVSMVHSLGFVINAVFLKNLVDGAAEHQLNQFVLYSVLFASTIFIVLGLRALEVWLIDYTEAVIENRFKQRLFASLLRKDYSSVTAIHTGEWNNRLTADTAVVANNVVTLLPWLAGMVVRIIGALAVICTILPWLAAGALLGGVLIVAVTASFKYIFKRLHKRIREADGNLRVFISERLGSLLMVRIFGAEKRSQADFEELTETHKKRRLDRTLCSNVCGTILGFLRDAAYLAGVLVCGIGMFRGTLSYGTFAAVTKLIMQIQFPFTSIVGYIPKYFATFASAERLMEVEEFQDDFAGGNPVPQDEIVRFYQNRFRSLGLRNACFTYPAVHSSENEPARVLNKLNLEIRKGDYTAFTGPSGCGKSTVLKILMAIYSLDSGTSFLKTEENEEILTAAWRGLFAFVPQGNLLIRGTIRDVVTMGDAGAAKNDAAIFRALEIACAKEFVEKLEKGLDTELGERGSGLSEGQTQRIAIARAVFSNRPILLLDEATSSLDAETEAHLLRNLRAMTDKTVIIVTHRASVFEICNQRIDFSPNAD